MTIAELIKERFPDRSFLKSDRKQAGKILKADGVDAAAAWLGSRPIPKGNFCPPAKCLILDFSRPLHEWPISRCSYNVQQYIYNLSSEQRKAEAEIELTSSKDHEAWFKRTGVDNAGYTHVQGLNKIFQNAFATYDGVVKKVANRNEKLKKRAAEDAEKAEREGRQPKEFKLLEAFDEDGFLKEKPGVNRCIWTYQTISPVPYDAKRHPQVAVPPNCVQAEPQAYVDRLSIPEGAPGHVPQWQRDAGLLSEKNNKRMRSWYSYHNNKDKPNRNTVRGKDECLALGASGAILVVITLGEDWVLLDIRGLLRNSFYRKVVRTKQVTTTKGLLDLFTGDPTLDPEREEVTFIYKEDTIPVFSRMPIREKKAPELFLNLTAPRDGIVRPLGIVSIDLGVTNPAAMNYYHLYRDGEEKIEPKLLGKDFLPPYILNKMADYRKRSDRLEERLLEQAIASLTEAEQAECKEVYGTRGPEYAAFIVDKLGVRPDLPWSLMSNWTTYITDDLIAQGKSPSTFHEFTVCPKGSGKKKKKKSGGAQQEVGEQKIPLQIKEKPTDGDWAHRYARKKLSEETREHLNEALWKLKRSSRDYARLSQQKRDLAREATNWVVKQTRTITSTYNVVVVVENINVVFFHGSGKREVGWDRFFFRKKENRWFVQALHKALTELAAHRGIWVVESAPFYTSLRCINCGYIDARNRCGEEFRCFQCGQCYHADLEVAPHNILYVAMQGESIKKPNPNKESDGAAKKAEDATPECAVLAPKKRKGAASGEVSTPAAEALA